MNEFLCRSTIYINDIHKLIINPNISNCDQKCHSNSTNNIQYYQSNGQDLIFIWVVLLFYLPIFLKIAIILIYFVMYSVTMKLYYYNIRLFESRSIQPKKIIKDCFSYLWIIIKKFYM